MNGDDEDKIKQADADAQDAKLPEGEAFFDFHNIEQVQKVRNPLREKLTDDLAMAYEAGFLRCAAATEFFAPDEFERLRKGLKGIGVSIGRWEREVQRLVWPERDRLVKAEKALKQASSAARSQQQSKKPEIELRTVAPWPGPVDTAQLFAEVEKFIKRFVYLSADQFVAVVLWIAFVYCFDAADISPRLAPLSPMRRCGKTVLLEVLGLLCPRVLSASNISSASTFRSIDSLHPTLLLDEIDSFAGRKNMGQEKADEIRGILNSGHRPSSAYVIRTEKAGNQLILRRFSTWAPIAYAAIGRLPPTWEDRSIVLRMRRRKRTEPIEKLTQRNLKQGIQKKADELGSKMGRWAQDNLDRLKKAPPPKIPKSLNDRAEDNWDLLLSIAELIGPEWQKRAYQAADSISGDRLDESTELDFHQQLLADIKVILVQTLELDSLAKSIGSTDLCTKLAALPDSIWASMRPNGKPITNRRLAMMLRPFEVYPMKQAARNEYNRRHLKDAIERYLPSETRPPDPSLT
jgi:putative DNA primase/helicase